MRWILEHEDDRLRRQFLQQVDLSQFQFPANIAQHQQRIVSLLRDDRVLTAYRLAFCKRILADLEYRAGNEEIDEGIFLSYTNLLSTPSSTLEPSIVVYSFPGDAVSICEQRALLGGHGTTGARTWEAALALAEYLIARPEEVNGKYILELGAGTGMLSIIARKLGAKMVYATDGHEDVCRAIKANVARNQADHIRVETLEWGNDTPAVHVVLGADITYDTKTLPQLLDTMLFALQSATHILLAATLRNEHTVSRYLSSCREKDLMIEHVGPGAPVFYYSRKPPVNLYRLCKKK